MRLSIGCAGTPDLYHSIQAPAKHLVGTQSYELLNNNLRVYNLAMDTSRSGSSWQFRPAAGTALVGPSESARAPSQPASDFLTSSARADNIVRPDRSRSRPSDVCSIWPTNTGVSILRALSSASIFEIRSLRI